MSVQHFDLIVIGSGPAGEKGAAQAAMLGKRVALIEREAVYGGTAANFGTLPSKALREGANYVAGFRQRGIRGAVLTLQDHVSAQDFLSRERLLRQLEQARIRSYLESLHVTLFHGQASFLDPHTLRVLGNPAAGGGQEQFLTASVILIACGASPHRPSLYPEKHPSILDSGQILNVSEIPSQLVIVGGGVIACEYASIFSVFGVQVTLVVEDSRLLPFLDGDLSTALLASLRAQNVDVRMEEKVRGLKPGPGLCLRLSSGAELTCGTILLAVGRTGNTADLNLSAAGLSADERGLLKVNERFQTSQPHIYAAGDVVGFPALASSAREQAHEAMIHAFAPEQDALQPPIQPYGIYTIPECSMAGETEEQLRSAGTPFMAGIAHYASNARGQIIGARSGFLKLLFHRDTQQLLGVHLIGEQATEIVHTGLLALQLKATTRTFLDACFNYPTLGELYKSATLDALAKRVAKHPAGSLPKPKM